MEKIFPDRYSIAILRELQRDARQTVQQIAERVGLSSTPCWKRIKDMEAAGIITGYSALIDRKRVGLGLRVVVEVNLSAHTEELVQQFERAVQATPAIVRCQATTGQSDYILSVLVADIERYERFLHAELFKLPGVAHVRSSIVLRDIKSDVRLPLQEPPEPAQPAPGSARTPRSRRSGRGGSKA